jgi:hypothetical protein
MQALQKTYPHDKSGKSAKRVRDVVQTLPPIPSRGPVLAKGTPHVQQATDANAAVEDMASVETPTPKPQTSPDPAGVPQQQSMTDGDVAMEDATGAGVSEPHPSSNSAGVLQPQSMTDANVALEDVAGSETSQPDMSPNPGASPQEQTSQDAIMGDVSAAGSPSPNVPTYPTDPPSLPQPLGTPPRESQASIPFISTSQEADPDPATSQVFEANFQVSIDTSSTIIAQAVENVPAMSQVSGTVSQFSHVVTDQSIPPFEAVGTPDPPVTPQFSHMDIDQSILPVFGAVGSPNLLAIPHSPEVAAGTLDPPVISQFSEVVTDQSIAPFPEAAGTPDPPTHTAFNEPSNATRAQDGIADSSDTGKDNRSFFNTLLR